MIQEIRKHKQAPDQKLTAQNIHNFGQKVINAGRVVGRKVINTLKKIEDLLRKALPIVSTIASMAGYPE